MKTVFAVALCFILGACAGEPDVFGFYDAVSMEGETLPMADGVSEAWLEARSDGVAIFTFIIPGPETMPVPGTFSVGEMENGCTPFSFRSDETPDRPMTGSICDGVMTAELAGAALVLHKRR